MRPYSKKMILAWEATVRAYRELIETGQFRRIR